MESLTTDQLFEKLYQGDITLNITLGKWAGKDPLKRYHAVCITPEDRGEEVIQAHGSTPQEALYRLYIALQELEDES